MPLFGSASNRVVRLPDGASAEIVCAAGEQDDCAAIRLTGQSIIVLGSDYVRGPKFALFEMGYLDYYDVGWYLAGANISDIAAMGAQPLGLLSIVRYPESMTDDQFRQVMLGIRDGCAAAGTVNLGGDIGSAERLILSASAFGMVEDGSLLRRSAAKPGQLVVLSGRTGRAGAALRAARAGQLERLASEVVEDLLAPWRRVLPRVAHGRVFAASKGVTACVDTSDGLKGALETLSERSAVSIVVALEDIPVDTGVRAAAARLEVDPLEVTLGDSVDFELVATVDPDCLEALQRACLAAALELFVIGRVREGPPLVADLHGRALPGDVWRHR